MEKRRIKKSMKMIKRLRSVLLVGISILIGMPCMAQSDGGGKKKKKVAKTEQTTSNNTKRKQEGDRRQQEAEAKRQQEEAQRQQEAEAKRQQEEAQRQQEAEAKRQQEEAQRQQEAEAKRQQEEFEKYQGHEYVDLGLPSGIKWATCNVGATSPGDYGDYYAWGEIRPKTTYTWSNCFDCLDSKGKNWSKGKGWGVYKHGGKIQITPTSGHDTVRENWGGIWRMPTVSEFEELNDKCIWEWSVRAGHNGYLVTGPNGKSIFLPAAGFRSTTDSHTVGDHGHYWSSSLSTSDSYYACNLYFFDGIHVVNFSGVRRAGCSVRPVTE